jgi:hypothetical protein
MASVAILPNKALIPDIGTLVTEFGAASQLPKKCQKHVENP